MQGGEELGGREGKAEGCEKGRSGGRWREVKMGEEGEEWWRGKYKKKKIKESTKITMRRTH